jgi:poly(3-hydroxybutyrate) depolymerase
MAVTSNILYGYGETTGSDVELRLDLYVPDDPPISPLPLVINFHGGGFFSGSKGGEQIVTLAETLNAAGFLFADCNYRIEGDNPDVPSGEVDQAEAAYPEVSSANAAAIVAAMYDMKTAVRWARANAATYRIDPNYIVTCGNSAGSIAALTCAASPTTKYVSDHASNHLAQSNAIQGCLCLWGGSELAVDLDWFSPSSPPVMIWHGDADANPYTNYSPRMLAVLAAMDTAEAPYTSYIIAGGGHVVWTQEQNGVSIYDTCAAWVRANVVDGFALNPKNSYVEKAFQ